MSALGRRMVPAQVQVQALMTQGLCWKLLALVTIGRCVHGAGSPIWTGRTSLTIPLAPARLVESVVSMASMELVLTQHRVRVVESLL